MKTRIASLSLPVVMLVAVASGRAEHADIELRVFRLDPATRAIKDQVQSHMDEEPPIGGGNPRPVLRTKVNEPLVVEFYFTNTYPHLEIRDVAVRYYVVQQGKTGQKEIPDLKKGTAAHGVFGLNFKPRTRVGAKVNFTIRKPGSYLVRVQSEKTHGKHEHFSAIDILVE